MRGLFTFLLWNGRTCPDLPHTAAADREIKMFAEGGNFRKKPSATFFRISVQTNSHKAEGRSFSLVKRWRVCSSLFPLFLFRACFSPFPRLKAPGCEPSPSPAVKLGYKGAEGVEGGNIN